MPQEPLEILAQNQAKIREAAQSLTLLQDGQRVELLRLIHHSSPADAYLHVFGPPLCTPEFARLCKAVAGGITDPSVLARFLPESEGTEGPTDTRTAYLRSAYTDRAFAVFGQTIHRLSAQYQTSFSAGCEEVYYGRCSYCILPIWNSEDGTLTSFTRMLAKYDLKICRVCDISMQDSEGSTRYALLRRGLDLHIPDRSRLQTTLVLPSGITTGQFLTAAEATGASIADISTIPLRYTHDQVSLHIHFQMDRASAAPLLLFLGAALDDFTPDGLYAFDTHTSDSDA